VVKGLLDKKRYPDPPGLFDIGRLGGWSKVNDDLFDPDNGKVAQIFEKQGRSTGSG
jgi:ABC-type sulfate transport system substrate-binding protein